MNLNQDVLSGLMGLDTVSCKKAEGATKAELYVASVVFLRRYNVKRSA